jgi:nitrogen regulatory protein PII
MKKIEAVILPARLDAVLAELERRGIHAALTLTGVQQDDASVLAEKETAGPLKDRVKMELIVGDRQAQKAVDIIMQYAQVATNEAAGHVALLKVNEALKIVLPLSTK